MQIALYKYFFLAASLLVAFLYIYVHLIIIIIITKGPFLSVSPRAPKIIGPGLRAGGFTDGGSAGSEVEASSLWVAARSAATDASCTRSPSSGSTSAGDTRSAPSSGSTCASGRVGRREPWRRENREIQGLGGRKEPPGHRMLAGEAHRRRSGPGPHRR
jgi:hypothetical protein